MKIWVNGDYSDLHGEQEGQCAKTQGVGSVWPFHTCACNCESEGRDEDRYFSLLAVKSDIDKNKYVINDIFIWKINYLNKVVL